MSNGKQQIPALGRVLEAAIKQGAAKNASDLPEDFNTLVLPNKQEIKEDRIKWTWEVHEYVNPDEDENPLTVQYTITGELFTKDTLKGEYYVEFGGDESPALPIKFVGDESKNVGKALISAWNYHNVWKDHAGYFIEKEVMGE